MATSISTANITNFSSDPYITHSTSGESNGDMAVVIVKEEALSDEWLLNCDSIEEFYEFADTSLPVDLEGSELIKECSILNTNKTPKHSSILVTLLPNSTLKSYQQTYKYDEDTWNTISKSALKLNVVGNEGEIDKCDKQPTLTKSVKVDKGKVVHLGPQKSENETIGTQGSQCGEHQFKCIHCNRIFGYESHLKMHMMGHNQSESFCLSPEQEIVIVKEEVLSDDEGALNYASVSECEYNGYISCPVDTKFLEVDGNNSVALENKTDRGSNIIGVLTGSVLENFSSYKDLKSDLGINSEPVKRHLGNSSDAIRKLESHKNCRRSVKVNGKKVKQQPHLETKPVTAPLYAAVHPEHRFQCQECGETFELKSHLVMHEIGHEKYRKYGPYPRYHISKQLQSDKPIHQCKECNAVFELKSCFTLHELMHDKQRIRPCHCRSASLASASDLCTCVVRMCLSCCRRFFASCRLRNWTLCVKCLPQGASKGYVNSSTAVKTEKIKVEKLQSKRSRSKMPNKTFFPSLVYVKGLCFSCGKVSGSDIKLGSLWMCYDCWNARLKYKKISNFLGLSKEIVPHGTAEYLRPNCAYCLKLYPLRSNWSNYQCFHKSVYLKGLDVDDSEVGQQFLLPPTPKSFEPSYLQGELIMWNQSSWFDDFNESEDEQEGEMVTDKTEVSDFNDGSSLSNVILCDKTGQLIDLRCEDELLAPDKNTKSYSEGEIFQRNSW